MDNGLITQHISQEHWIVSGREGVNVCTFLASVVVWEIRPSHVVKMTSVSRLPVIIKLALEDLRDRTELHAFSCLRPIDNYAIWLCPVGLT